jgi:hypothetical protein
LGARHLPIGVLPVHGAELRGRLGGVWGTDFYASYGYPAGGNIGTINEVVVPPVPR